MPDTRRPMTTNKNKPEKETLAALGGMVEEDKEGDGGWRELISFLLACRGPSWIVDAWLVVGGSAP
eukprot:scaffold10582_cov60-Attheya_sp.AAC.2